MASQAVLVTDWADYQWFTTDYVPKQTVPSLRLFATIIENESRQQCYVRSSDRKADIVSRIQDCFARMKASGDIRTYGKVRYECEKRGQPQHKPYNVPAPTFGGVPATSHNAPSGSSYTRPSVPTTNGYGGSYNNAGPSRPGGSNWQTTHNRPPPALLDWKPNPMWKPIKAITAIELLPDISHNENSHVRRERKTNFAIPNDVIEKLNYTRDHPDSHPQYAVRLFCTSSDHYKPPGMQPLPGQPVPTNRHIPIEYPSNPDIMVDSYPLSFKEKGLRGKAGSAPPFDLGKGPHGLSRVPGRMTTVTMGHSGPTVGKKKDSAKRFFYQIVFAEMTSKGELLNRLKGLVPTSVEASLAEFKKRQEEDDDIVVGTSVMSLKDPLAYMRMTRPVRSSKCTHIQCFDAQWWIESNAQHPQWHCPHCGKELQFPELIVDGYVLSILNACPDSVDDVVLEPSGDWHTEDNKYGSAPWMATHGAAAAPPIALDKKPELAPSPQSNGTPAETAIPKRKIVELLSDSDDEDEPEQPLSRLVNGTSRPNIPPPPATVPPRLTPAPTPITAGPSSGRSSMQPANDIIDLTISDSEDEEDADEPPSASQTYFRGPDAEYTNRNAVDSNQPLQSLNNTNQNQSNVRGSVVRPPSGDDFMTHVERIMYRNGQGTAARGGGTWINPLEEEQWINSTSSSTSNSNSDSRFGQNPPPGPRGATSTNSSSTYGLNSGSGSGLGLGSISNKRPRADQWLDDERSVDPRRNQSTTNIGGTGGGGFSSYSSNQTGFNTGIPPRSQPPITRPPDLRPIHQLPQRPGGLGIPNAPHPFSSPLPSPTIQAPRPPPLSSSSPLIPSDPVSSGPSRQVSNQNDRSKLPNIEPQSAGGVKSPSLKITIPNPNYKGERNKSNNSSRSNTPLNQSTFPNSSTNPTRGIHPFSSPSGQQEKRDVDAASLELNPRSSEINSPNSNLPIYSKLTSNSTSTSNNNTGNNDAGSSGNGNGDNEEVDMEIDIDEDDDQAERSSDLGLGMDTMEENFWEGVLNGDIDI